MRNIEVILPAMGEGIIDATITKWLVALGQNVEEDTPIVEIATDKVDSEIPAPAAGKLTSVLFKEGEIPKVGQVIAIIEVEGEEDTPIASKVNSKTSEVISPTSSIPENKSAGTTQPISSDIFLSPLVRSIAKEENVSNAEMATVRGSGVDGRVTKEDMLSFLKSRHIAPTKTTQNKPTPAQPTKSSENLQEIEVVPMDRMRKIIADHMVMSKQTSPHVTSFIDVDLTGIVKWRDRVKNDFQKKEGQKLTYTPIFFEAIAKAIKEFPGINASVDGDRILLKKRINLGMATALPSGNLIVPVIKNAEHLSLTGMAFAVNDLAERARNNNLLLDEIQGGTFTVTNLGAFDTLAGTPIINQPQVAILAIGAIKKTPVVIESELGDTIGIRSIAILSLAYDHRVVDGALGGMFLRRIKTLLEQFDTNRTY
ncbi:dihydrolipoamide acetyltransferase family protein [Williamwhitmania taraxaci]|uniref:Dihydrolipoamide acetyltransferase component of pyruvate dehydrogenase complex n=1 Tax=Williamwhitmania taraxaci TaxID=1640674 RepID=A0A1G6GSB0_9BACT|nr:dihydrolipoamide acetyltransferase family protein [Williamwhitmania taraxaci]SDB84809.1 2-oxoglutarate dehydrogenase E2 component (dihydrolipoamide succinyltransferase) [Williamwhitmania taraxaci]